MANKITLKAKGLFLNSNSLSAIPDGGLLEADDIIIDKDDIIESRRGFVLYGDAMGIDESQVSQQLINYQERLIRHYLTSETAGVLERETSSVTGEFEEYNILVWDFVSSVTASGSIATLTTPTDHGILVGDLVVIDGATGVDSAIYNGTFTVITVPSPTKITYQLSAIPSNPVAEGYQILQERSLNNMVAPDGAFKIRSTESNGNLYFTSNEGIRKLDAVDSTITMAGGVKALDTDVEVIRESGFLSTDSQVAYRVLWGFKDANQNLILGAPSQRVVVSNDILPSIINDINNLLEDTQNAADAATGADVLNNSPTGDYALYTDLSLQSTDSATITDLTLREYCDKLEADGVTGFVAIASQFPAPSATSATTEELNTIVEFYDTIITNLLVSDQISNEQQDIAGFTSSSVGTKVSISFTVPDNITTGYFYQIYRTAVIPGLNDNLLVGNADIAGDDMKLVFEDNPTLAQLSDKKVEIVDITPDSFRGTPLYTNSNQEGILNANSTIPFGNDLAVYQNMLFVANTKTRYFLNFSFLATVSLSSNVAGNASTLIVTSGSNSFTIGFRTASDGGEDINAGICLLTQSGTPGQNVDDTARSLVKVINRFSGNDLVYAYYLSGVTDVPGRVLIEAKSLASPVFTIQANNSSAGSQFSPNLTNPQSADNEEKGNRLYYSKFQEPEAFTSLQFFEVGRESDPIQRILALRDSLFVLKADGIFKITGDSNTNLSLTPFDTSTRLVAPESAVVLDNKLYFLSDQGVASASETGVDIISRSIENVLIPLIDPRYTNFRKATFGIAYETDRKYILYTVDETDDLWATQAYVYNTFTRAWTRWTNSKTCGIVNQRDGKLYLGASDINSLEVERKELNYTDYADRDYPINIFSVTSEKAGKITAVASGENPAISVDAPDHGLINDDTIIISNSNTSPDINDIPLSIKKLDNQTIIIPVTVSGEGTQGEWRSGNTTILAVDSVANIEIGDVILQDRVDPLFGYTYQVEGPVSAIDATNLLVTINIPLLFGAGAARVFKAIPNRVRYSPQHSGDPFVLKHFREAHIRFDSFNGSGIELSFNSDIQKSFQKVNFAPDAITRWGSFAWGSQPWGGESFPIVFRTYVPLGKQKCSFLGVVFEHKIAREAWELEGIDLVFEVISERISD